MEEGRGGRNRIIRGMITLLFCVRGRGIGIASLFEQGLRLVMDLVRSGRSRRDGSIASDF